MAKHQHIVARVAELRAAMAQEIVTTPKQQFRALKEVRQFAMGRRDPSGAISAILQKARLFETRSTDQLGCAPREPVTNREAAVKMAKMIRRHGFELKEFRRSAQRFEAMIDLLLANETPLDEEDVLVCDTVPLDNQSPTLQSAH